MSSRTLHSKKRLRSGSSRSPRSSGISVQITPVPPESPPRLVHDRTEVLTAKNDLGKLLRMTNPEDVMSKLIDGGETVSAFLMATSSQKLYDHCYVTMLSKPEERNKMLKSMYQFTNKQFLIETLQNNPDALKFMIQNFPADKTDPIIREMLAGDANFITRYQENQELLDSLLVMVLRIRPINIPMVKALVDTGAESSLIFTTSSLANKS